jgi:hypothetical protein
MCSNFYVTDVSDTIIEHYYTDSDTVSGLIALCSTTIIDGASYPNPQLRESRNVFLSLLQNNLEIKFEDFVGVIRYVAYLWKKQDENRTEYTFIDFGLCGILHLLRPMLKENNVARLRLK